MPRKAPPTKVVSAAKKRQQRQHNNGKVQDTRVSVPKASSSILEYGAPNMSSTKSGVRIRHSELIRAVMGSIVFAADVVPVNPGLIESFPWLSAIGNSYESYKVHSIGLRYVPRVSANTSGLILLSADYNTGDPSAMTGPTNEQMMSTTPGAVECPVWAGATFKLDASRFTYPRYFTRLNRVEDLELYDPAVMYIGTSAMADGSAVGRVYIEYDIEFMIPQFIHTLLPHPTKFSAFQATGQNILVPNSALVTFAPNFNPLGVTLPSTSNFQLETGAYIFDVCVNVQVPTNTSGCAGILEILQNGVVLALDPNFGWSTVEAEFTPSIGVSATLRRQMQLRGVVTTNNPTNIYAIRYSANGTAAGNHTVITGGSWFTIQAA